jgi:hypothetical protein
MVVKVCNSGPGAWETRKESHVTSQTDLQEGVHRREAVGGADGELGQAAPERV